MINESHYDLTDFVAKQLARKGLSASGVHRELP